MKLIRSLSLLTAFAVIVPTASFAAEKKAAKKEAAAPAAESKKAGSKPAAEAKKSDAKPAAEASGKALPMNSRVDSIDAASKSFTMKKKDGTEVKHVISASAEIKNNGADAKFDDIKVGDTVSGLRVKKSDTEYEVTKITKFGAAAPKKAKGEGEKEGAKKPGAKKE